MGKWYIKVVQLGDLITMNSCNDYVQFSFNVMHSMWDEKLQKYRLGDCVSDDTIIWRKLEDKDIKHER